MQRDLTVARRLIERAASPAAKVLPSRPDDAPQRVAHDTEVVVHLQGGEPGQRADLILRQDDAEHVQMDTVLVVRKASTARLRELRLADVQFVDVGRGIVRLRLPWMYIDRTDLEIPVVALPPTGRAYRDPFGDRASLISRLLVEQPARRWGAREIAEEAGVSTMTASHVLRQLREMGVLDARKRGNAFETRLRDLPGLVGSWTRHYEWTRCQKLEVQASMGSPDRFMARLPSLLTGRRWALTMQAGARRVEPHANWETLHVYVDVDSITALADVASSAGWEPGPGKLVLMRPWYAHSAWVGMRTMDGLPVVSDLQLVLDLWHYPVRGREQAEMLLRRMENRMQKLRAQAS
jgi:hypothetical protein